MESKSRDVEIEIEAEIFGDIKSVCNAHVNSLLLKNYDEIEITKTMIAVAVNFLCLVIGMSVKEEAWEKFLEDIKEDLMEGLNRNRDRKEKEESRHVN